MSQNFSNLLEFCKLFSIFTQNRMKMEKIIEIEGFYFEAILNGYFCSETRIKVSQKGIECGYMPLTKETAENRRKCWFAAQKLKQKIYAK